MKGSLLTGFRALAFALGAFVLLALGGIKIRTSMDVFLFVVGLTAFWIVIERVFMSMKKNQNKTPGK